MAAVRRPSRTALDRTASCRIRRSACSTAARSWSRDRHGDIEPGAAAPAARLLLRGHALRVALAADRAGPAHRHPLQRARGLLRRAVLPRLARRPEFHAAPPLGHHPPAARSATSGSRTSWSSTTATSTPRSPSTSRSRTDFADLFEVKDGQVARAPHRRRASRARARPALPQRRLRRARRRITRQRAGHDRGRRHAAQPLAGAARGAAHLVRDHPALRPARPHARRRAGAPARFDELRRERLRRARAPGWPTRRRSRPTSDTLRQVYRRSLIDLAALRFYPHMRAGRQRCRPPGCRGSWRCSAATACITSYQALPFVPELAAHHAARPGRAPGHRCATTSATPSPARSCTSCASAS